MKVICISQYNGSTEFHLLPETALLVNDKPLFIPHFTTDLRAIPCALLHINRLGRNIEARFAARYYDKMAIGLHFIANDMLTHARHTGSSLSPAIAFDGSLALSQWTEITSIEPWNIAVNSNNISISALCITAEQAIARASQYFKLCTGDIICIETANIPATLQINDHIELQGNGLTISMNIK